MPTSSLTCSSNSGTPFHLISSLQPNADLSERPGRSRRSSISSIQRVHCLIGGDSRAVDAACCRERRGPEQQSFHHVHGIRRAAELESAGRVTPIRGTPISNGSSSPRRLKVEPRCSVLTRTALLDLVVNRAKNGGRRLLRRMRSPCPDHLALDSSGARLRLHSVPPPSAPPTSSTASPQARTWPAGRDRLPASRSRSTPRH
jgi:hypothetical protein